MAAEGWSGLARVLRQAARAASATTPGHGAKYGYAGDRLLREAQRLTAIEAARRRGTGPQTAAMALGHASGVEGAERSIVRPRFGGDGPSATFTP